MSDGRTDRIAMAKMRQSSLAAFARKNLTNSSKIHGIARKYTAADAKL